MSPRAADRGRGRWVDLAWALLWVAALAAAALCSGRGSKFIYIDF